MREHTEISSIIREQLLKFSALIEKRLLDEPTLEKLIRKSIAESIFLEDLLLALGVPKYEILSCLSNYYDLPTIEYDDLLLLDESYLSKLDLEKCKKNLYFPIYISHNKATVVCYDPENPQILMGLQEDLGIDTIIKKIIAVPSDVILLVENNQDVIHNFPEFSNRTILAKLRTYLANCRTSLSQLRTAIAQGRTGLAFIRTGFCFIAIALLAYRLFGLNYFLIVPEILLLGIGLFSIFDGFKWYIPARALCKNLPKYKFTKPTFGTTVLKLEKPGEIPVLKRVGPIEGARELLDKWEDLTSVIRRRFFSIVRTDLAEERTKLAYSRTIMAAARTGLAFARTGISFIGLGVGLIRHFHLGRWTPFDLGLIVIGTLMSLEGLYWHIPGIKACKEIMQYIREIEHISFWNKILFSSRTLDTQNNILTPLPLDKSLAPGILGSTGLSLQRIINAEERNIRSRLRTIMAISRTGMAIIRTGAKVFSIGLGLLVYFGIKQHMWTAFDATLVISGLAILVLGFYIFIPADRVVVRASREFKDFEILMPDYGKPKSLWKRLIIYHEGV